MTAPEQPPTPGQPRLLVPVTIAFAVRYLVRTGLLAQLAAHAEVVVGLTWEDADLQAELAAAGVAVVALPKVELPAAGLGHLADLEVAFARRLRSPSAPIDRRRRHVDLGTKLRFRRWLTYRRRWLRMLPPGAEARATAALAAELDRADSLAPHLDLLREHRIDAVLSLTPFVVQELLLLRAARAAGLPCATSILSFDNLTTRPALPITFDRYLVWNRFNAAEVRRAYPEVTTEQVTVVGPAQFDFYARPDLVDDEAAWRRRLGLSPHHRTLLYGAGPTSVSPHEAQYVEDLLAAIDDGRLPADLRIVLRRHPVDLPERWARFADHPAVAFDDPGELGASQHRPGEVNLGQEQIRALCTSLAHGEVHVSVSSTMTLDGAFYDRPQIGPAYDRSPARRHRRRARDLYRREHFLPIVASGGLELATGPDHLVALVSDALDRPDRLRTERRAMLEALCTYLDGACTDRVAAAVAAFLRSEVRPPR